MSTEQVFITREGPFTVPETYVLSQSETFRPSVINATFNGAGASGSFLPCCTIYSQTGKLISRTFPETVAAGDTAEVTYGPFLQAPSPVAAGVPGQPGLAVYADVSYPTAVLDETSLIAYWRMNTVAGVTGGDVSGVVPETDLSQQTGTGASSGAGTPPIGTGAVPVFGYATTNPNAEANSGSVFFRRPTSTKFVGLGALAFTVECWFNPSSAQGILPNNNDPELHWGPIINSYTGGGNTGVGWMLTMDYDSSAFGQLVLVGGTSPRDNPAFRYATAGLTTNTWYYAVVACDGTNFKLYLNALLVAQGPASQLASGDNFVNQIASAAITGPGGVGTWQRNFVGILGEIAVYSTELSAIEIAVHYISNGTTHYGSITGLAGGAISAGSIATEQLQDGAVTAAKISGTLKPSVSAGPGTEALRALGTSAATAAAGNDPRLGNPPSSGALSTVAPVSGTAFRVDTTVDRELLVPVTLTPTAGAAATCLVELSPNNANYTTVGTLTVPAGTALDSIVDVLTVRVPQSWWVRLTATNATIGTGVYY